jgi:hypothetical protein
MKENYWCDHCNDFHEDGGDPCPHMVNKLAAIIDEPINPTAQPTPDLQAQILPNRIGWYAIKHRDGWFIGTASGVTCYATEELARAANTIANERVWDQGSGYPYPFRIQVFTEACHPNGEHTPKRSASAAVRNIERRAK